MSDGPVRIGTTYRQVRSLPRRSEETLRVTAFEPDRRFAIHGGLGPFEGTLTYEFEDIGGVTRLTNRAQLEARGMMKIAAPLASGRVRDALAANLRALKVLLDRRDRSSGLALPSPPSGRYCFRLRRDRIAAVTRPRVGIAAGEA
jgi:hypothetical protein